MHLMKSVVPWWGGNYTAVARVLLASCEAMKTRLSVVVMQEASAPVERVLVAVVGSTFIASKSLVLDWSLRHAVCKLKAFLSKTKQAQCTWAIL